MKAKFVYIIFSIIFTVLNTGCDYFLQYPTPPVDYSGQIDSITDIDGNVYKTIGIGTQIWMAENLKTTRLNDGIKIPLIKEDTAWAYVYAPAYCFYNNDSALFGNTYGALYNFYAVNTEKLCPDGWRVPSKSDWEILSDFLGGDRKSAGKLKDIYGPYWQGPNPCFTNNLGFAALPGGFRETTSGKFLQVREKGSWWSSSFSNDFFATIRYMSYSSTFLGIEETRRSYGNSVRCVKEE